MQATSNGLRDYNQSVEKNFTKIVEVADKLVPNSPWLKSGFDAIQAWVQNV
jgi:ElaB/YqjD/DUF883 family membrane-anchored ribosome-binding protein